MRKTLIATAILVLAGSSAAYAQIAGGTSNSYWVTPGAATFPSSSGNSGLQMRLSTGSPPGVSAFIDIYAGPITQVTGSATANSAGPFYANLPILPIDIAQTWWNNQNNEANVYSLRQTRTLILPNYPQFGGLVIGQVKYKDSSNPPNYLPYAQGNGVYFGEWSKSVASPSKTPSTNLNMTDASHTVWYVGDNATTSMPNLTSAQYAVVGISQTGTVDGGLPHAPNLYKGTLTASYTIGMGGSFATGSTISRTVSGGTQTVDFAGASIISNGSFSKGTSGAAGSIQGQFYNGANALAGIALSDGVNHGDVAFGGSLK